MGDCTHIVEYKLFRNFLNQLTESKELSHKLLTIRQTWLLIVKSQVINLEPQGTVLGPLIASYLCFQLLLSSLSSTDILMTLISLSSSPNPQLRILAIANLGQSVPQNLQLNTVFQNDYTYTCPSIHPSIGPWAQCPLVSTTRFPNCIYSLLDCTRMLAECTSIWHHS